MSVYLALANSVAVSLFGSILSASFCRVLEEKKTRWGFWCAMVVILLAQGGVSALWDTATHRAVYPLVVHLPLLVVLWLLTRRLLWPLISILSAYLCCELRRWLALLATALLRGGEMVQDICELVVTLPLLLLLLHFFAPVIRELSDQPVRRQCVFGLIPAVYYVFDYALCVYTDLLYRGGAAAVEFMPFVCCLVYMAFLLYHSAREQTESQLQQVQKSLDLQLNQAVREINALRESQTLASRYRHDLRHHLQYLSTCIESGQTEQAQSYISGICQEIESQRVQHYCENEAANLILSAFMGRARAAGIPMTVEGALPVCTVVSDSDLCVLLSNALENALHACQALTAAGGAAHMELQMYERGGKLFFQLTNSCGEETILFKDGLPVSRQAGHGIGVQSICAIVRKYGGVYTFLVKDGQFILRCSL